jgi:cytochrome c2
MEYKTIIAAAAVATALLAGATQATAASDPGDKKIGRVYFKMVCTVCHMTQTGKAIPPNSRTMAEWRTYLDADRHDKSGKSKSTVHYYISQEYRKSVQDTNKAAQKFIDVPNDQLYANVRAFVISGAKDSDTPASCQ